MIAVHNIRDVMRNLRNGKLMTSFIDKWSIIYFCIESSEILDYLNCREETFV
jgi:hypothetical protein